MEQNLIPVIFEYGDENNFFLSRYVWDSETHHYLVLLSSLINH